ncbi:MAG TPA: zinc ribbon domain-containing protein [Thermoplasmata archaeon]|nr:zinc ribbon domain-containing protein [Thermoplasmata archaeon]
MTRLRSRADVSAQFCSGCGAPVSPGSQFCAYCGQAVASGPGGAAGGVPLPPAGPTPPPYPAAPGMGMPAPRGRPRRWLVVAVVVILVIAVVGVLLYYEANQDNVDVNVFIVWAPDNVCGLNEPDNLLAYSGLNDTPGNTDYIQFPVPNYNATACSLESVSTNTSGFTAVPSSLPVVVPVNGTGILNLNLTLPGSPWSGDVNLVFG